MSEQLFQPDDPVLKSIMPEYCNHVLKEAIESNRQVIRIRWDDPDIPEHARGYVQWSTRPYLVTDCCDGTRDSCCQWVTYVICKALGIDADAVYTEAYPDRELESGFYSGRINYLEKFSSQVIIPTLSSQNLKFLLRSMYDMNFRQLAEVFESKFEELGFDMTDLHLL